MPTVLHLFKSPPDRLASETIRAQVGAGDHVEVAFLEGAPSSLMPTGVTVHLISIDLTYDALLEKIFAADQVIAW